ncbi:hypothetical protein LCGC14_1862360, partial [marine sediment metagenome]
DEADTFDVYVEGPGNTKYFDLKIEVLETNGSAQWFITRFGLDPEFHGDASALYVDEPIHFLVDVLNTGGSASSKLFLDTPMIWPYITTLREEGIGTGETITIKFQQAFAGTGNYSLKVYTPIDMAGITLPVEITTPPPTDADIRVVPGSLSVTPTTIGSGDTITLAMNIKNYGNALGSTDILINVGISAYEVVNQEYAAGEERMFSTSIKVNELLGSYTVYVKTRDQLTTPESVDIVIAEAPPPVKADIRTVSGTMTVSPTEINTGDTISISVELKNYGDADGQDILQIKVADGAWIGMRVVGLHAGENVIKTLDYRVRGPEGSISIFARMEKQPTTPESAPIVVILPPSELYLKVVSVELHPDNSPDRVSVGKPIKFIASVANTGDISGSDIITVVFGPHFMTEFDTGDISPGTEVDVVFTVTFLEPESGILVLTPKGLGVGNSMSLLVLESILAKDGIFIPILLLGVAALGMKLWSMGQAPARRGVTA